MTYAKPEKKESNPGNHGEHTVGGAIGAAVGAATAAVIVGAAEGAAVGTVAGLPGMLAGVGIGGVLGALAGKEAAQLVNPTTEDDYWRENYKHRAYFDSLTAYDGYAPAYRFGIEAYTTYAGRSFDEIEAQLGNQWEKARGTSRLTWDTAKLASKDAYERLSENKA
jgi:hypothetical protein